MKNWYNNSKFLNKWLLLTLATLTLSCVATGNSNLVRQSSISIEGGPNFGAFNHEKDRLDAVSGASTDVVTGATQWKYNTAVHSELIIKNHAIETGLEYYSFTHKLDYEDYERDFIGSRDFKYHQLRVPLTYNFHLLPNADGLARLKIKFGFSVGYTFSKSIEESGSLPDYKFNNWDLGSLFGFTIYPVTLMNNSRIGFYCDFYRGIKSPVYEDFYLRDKNVGNLTNARLGVTWQFYNF